jgi:hypothetical protein
VERWLVDTLDARFLYYPEEVDDKLFILPPESKYGRASTPIQLVAISKCSYDLTAIANPRCAVAAAKLGKGDSPNAPVNACNALWVGWNGKMAYRKSIGLIYLDVWESWNPKSATILLG